ncbi:DUF6366 family protein [Halobacillus rhizosphaerae]|uniref:DUF6366 family protein n=1 Tax=Halobacillus rhizosphaerae TaxID=3064889 RepID=UPI00398B6828
MGNEKETPEERRDRLRQKELNNPSSSIHGSISSDLVGGLGWKGTGVIILLLIVGFIIYGVFFR